MGQVACRLRAPPCLRQLCPPCLLCHLPRPAPAPPCIAWLQGAAAGRPIRGDAAPGAAGGAHAAAGVRCGACLPLLERDGSLGAHAWLAHSPSCLVPQPHFTCCAPPHLTSAVSPAAAGSRTEARRKRAREPVSPPQRHPLQELTQGGGNPAQQQQQRWRQRQQQQPAAALQPAAGSGGTWLKNAAHRPQ